MSWTFEAIGRAPAVLAKANKHFDLIRTSEPEQSIKNKVLNILQIALTQFPDDVCVQVVANGMQSSDGTTGKNTNQLNFIIRPVSDFVE